MQKPLAQSVAGKTNSSGVSSDQPLNGIDATSTSANLSRERQIDALTSTRAIAAILVFIHHFGPANIFPPAFHVGNIAVCYFFVLSGFVLYLSYQHKQISYGDYIRKRIGRIVPVYLLALVSAVVVAAAFSGYQLTTARSIKEIVLSAFFLQAFVPTYPLILNLPGWTISVEMFFYVLFPLLLFVQNKSVKVFAVISGLLFIASQWIHLKYFPDRKTLGDDIVDTVFFSPWIHLSQFLLGMIAGYIFKHKKDIVPRLRFLPLVIFIAAIAMIGYRACNPENLSYQVGLLDPLFMFLILSIAVNNPRVLNVRPLVYLGEISYGIYILQWPTYQFLQAMNDRYFQVPMPWFFFCSLSALIAFAALSYHCMEVPLKRMIAAKKGVY